MKNSETVLGNGIVKSSSRSISVFVDKNNNEYVCDTECVDRLDPSLSFEEQACDECQSNPFDIGG